MKLWTIQITKSLIDHERLLNHLIAMTWGLALMWELLQIELLALRNLDLSFRGRFVMRCKLSILKISIHSPMLQLTPRDVQRNKPINCSTVIGENEHFRHHNSALLSIYWWEGHNCIYTASFCIYGSREKHCESRKVITEKTEQKIHPTGSQ